jgi:hypothetical protein
VAAPDFLGNQTWAVLVPQVHRRNIVEHINVALSEISLFAIKQYRCEPGLTVVIVPFTPSSLEDVKLA